MVRYPFKPKLDALIWAHEFAHTTGSPHRNDPQALMQPMMVVENRKVNVEECQRLMAGSQAAFDAVPGKPQRFEPLPMRTPSIRTNELRGSDRFRAFMERDWPEGVPFVREQDFTTQDTEAALALLGQKRRNDLWLNAVAFLGAVGSTPNIEALQNFSLHHRAGNAAEQRDAVGAVPIAIGWIAGRACKRGDKSTCTAGIKALTEMSRIEWWQAGSSGRARGAARITGKLVLKVAIGLALADNDAAMKHIEAMRDALTTNSSGPLPAADPALVRPPSFDARAALEGILKEAKHIKAIGGLENYYQLAGVAH